MEMADGIVVNKADGDNVNRANRAAAERAAAERAAAEKWKLSDREMQMVGMLGGGA